MGICKPRVLDEEGVFVVGHHVYLYECIYVYVYGGVICLWYLMRMGCL